MEGFCVLGKSSGELRFIPFRGVGKLIHFFFSLQLRRLVSIFSSPFGVAVLTSPRVDYVGGFLATTLHGLQVQCKEVDLAIFNPPPGQTCVAYAGEWVNSTVGYLVNPDATSDCE